MSHQDDLLRILHLANTIRQLGSFLDRVLVEPVLARVFLLHRDELFQRQSAIEQNILIPLGTAGLPLMSHPVSDLRRSLARHATKVETNSPRWPQGRGEEFVQNLQDATGDRPIDAIVIAILNTIRNNPRLRDLVTGDERVTQSTLRTRIKTYETISVEGIEDDWAAAANVLMAGRGGRTFREMFLHVDLLKGMVDLERFQVALLERVINHWEHLLRARKIKDIDWRRTLLDLHQQCLVEHLGPLCLWCNRCPETGVTARVATSFVLHPALCPRCGQPAFAATEFAPIPPLRETLELHDGVLGAAIGRWLDTRRMQFAAGKDVGGYEVDYVIPMSDGVVMVECKMNHVMEGQGLSRKVHENRNQLRDHVRAAISVGLRVCSAACVVNIQAPELKRILGTIGPEPEAAFNATGATLLSYEDAGEWLSTHTSPR